MMQKTFKNCLSPCVAEQKSEINKRLIPEAKESTCVSALVNVFVSLYLTQYITRVLLYITNNSIRHQSFVYTQLIGQRALFLRIQFNMNHLFSHSLNVKQFYLIHR